MDSDKCFELFYQLIDMAEESRACGDLRSSVAMAQIAARLAYPARAGLFGSPRLEALLIDIGRAIPSPPAVPVPHHATELSGRHVMHVLSYARPVGGDTRYAWRWIEADQSSRHSVAVTTQADVDGLYTIPVALTDAITRSGGLLHILKAPPSDPLSQALELRALMQDAHVVVLHIFPYDVIPILALATGCDAKTVYVNHSDHTFWLGASVSHRVLHLREQSARVLQKRHLGDGDGTLLPIPLAQEPPSAMRSAAKALIGCDESTLVLLTIASPFKFASPGRVGLLDLVLPVLAETDGVVLLAVGPTASGDWADADARTQGRVKALGTRYDTGLLYAAADVYLDSVPFSSITSILEAGSYGVPLLGMVPPDADLLLLGPGAPGLNDVMEMAADPEDHRRLLRRLIRDKNYRLGSGQRARARILSQHAGENWHSAVQTVYRTLQSATSRGCLAYEAEDFIPPGLSSALNALYGPANRRHVRRLLWKFLAPLSYRTRARIVWRLYQTGFQLSLSNLLPSWMNRTARVLVRRWADAHQ